MFLLPCVEYMTEGCILGSKFSTFNGRRDCLESSVVNAYLDQSVHSHVCVD